MNLTDVGLSVGLRVGFGALEGFDVIGLLVGLTFTIGLSVGTAVGGATGLEEGMGVG
jgi:hypothetical protein